jgi:hypothetical protein
MYVWRETDKSVNEKGFEELLVCDSNDSDQQSNNSMAEGRGLIGGKKEDNIVRWIKLVNCNT